ncbi:hypothetical protein CI594_09255, partial [Fischerella thermalis CCMEE 5196]
FFWRIHISQLQAITIKTGFFVFMIKKDGDQGLGSRTGRRTRKTRETRKTNQPLTTVQTCHGMSLQQSTSNN